MYIIKININMSLNILSIKSKAYFPLLLIIIIYNILLELIKPGLRLFIAKGFKSKAWSHKNLGNKS